MQTKIKIVNEQKPLEKGVLVYKMLTNVHLTASQQNQVFFTSLNRVRQLNGLR